MGGQRTGWEDRGQDGRTEDRCRMGGQRTGWEDRGPLQDGRTEDRMGGQRTGWEDRGPLQDESTEDRMGGQRTGWEDRGQDGRRTFYFYIFVLGHQYVSCSSATRELLVNSETRRPGGALSPLSPPYWTLTAAGVPPSSPGPKPHGETVLRPQPPPNLHCKAHYTALNTQSPMGHQKDNVSLSLSLSLSLPLSVCLSLSISLSLSLSLSLALPLSLSSSPT